MSNAYYDLLVSTVEAMNARIQEDRIESHDDDNFYDALHEVVDGMVPLYYKEVFEVMAADGIDVEFDDSGLLPDTKNVMSILQARIYEALYNDTMNNGELVFFKSEDEEDDDEENGWYFVCEDDMTSPKRVLDCCRGLEDAKRLSHKFLEVDGIACHVEGEYNTDWLYIPTKGQPHNA